MNFKKLFGKNKDRNFNVMVIVGSIALIVFFMKYNKDKNVTSLGMRNLSPMELEKHVLGRQPAKWTLKK